jgi:Trk K+ transport system NAD-binding subunit
MITYSHWLYEHFGRYLSIFERAETPREPGGHASEYSGSADILIFGMGRFGTAMGLRLQQRGFAVMGVDFNPSAVQRAKQLGLRAEYGDATDPEFVSSLPLENAQWLVSTVPRHPTGLSHEDSRHTLMQIVGAEPFHGKVAVASHNSLETEELHRRGADTVLEPFQDAADRAVDLICGAQVTQRTPIPHIAPEERSDGGY